jgi:SNF2 family DNA or RNA helicase
MVEELIMLNIFKKKTNSHQSQQWFVQIKVEGLLLSKQNNGSIIRYQFIESIIKQLQDTGLGVMVDEDFLLSWDDLYQAYSIEGYEDLNEILSIPKVTEATPSIVSFGSLTDSNFDVAISHWQDVSGREIRPALNGAVLTENNQQQLLKKEQWELVKNVKAFASRGSDERSDLFHRTQWGKIRRLAMAAEARLDAFLHASIVLTPEKLKIALNKSQSVGHDSVIEVIPQFEGVPDSWIDRFDANSAVLDRYDIPTEDGIIQVILSAEVKVVLNEIKKMPGRMVAGSRAQAFLVNPFAALGDDASNIIEEGQFQKAKEDAGIFFERFTPIIERNDFGKIEGLGLLVESPHIDGDSALYRELLDDSELEKFVDKAQRSIDKDLKLIAWDGYDLEVNPDTPSHIKILQEALQEKLSPSLAIRYEDVHDLSQYSDRIIDIGVEEPYYSPFIAKKDSDIGWFSENIIPLITFTPTGESESIAIPINKETLIILQAKLEEAKLTEQKTITVSGLDHPFSIPDAERIVRTFTEVWADVAEGKFKEPKKKSPSSPEKSSKNRKTLVLRSNIETVGYIERRAMALSTDLASPEIPSSISEDACLMKHQLEGVAWLQHLYKLQRDFNIRGALLADDMGLGKTFQLLTLMAWILEKNPSSDPILIVAPLSLLENWKDEAEKFFPNTFKILTAYGDGLATMRIKREEIDARLKTEDGLVKFLRPGWIKNAKVVLTTYETLRDLEFSFAQQKWSLMICDEAQKIKNPAAMVTRSAWRQNVGFRIACTGTPVENTLTDLWSLFEFCQPGMLGPLNDFGRNYRKPIEIDSRDVEGIERLAQLRLLIEPQLLRRTKAEVAKDLPSKIIVDSCRRLPISSVQLALYAKAIEDFKKRNDPNFSSPFKNHLGLLQYIRLLCTDPRRYGLSVFKPEPIKQYREASPKLDWLLNQLGEIKKLEQKAIVFCEFKNIQRLLQHYIRDQFDFDADIINGDTNTSSGNDLSRQKRIKAFQAKPGFGVIILSPVAVGFGVNIQGANHVVHFMRTWNPAKEDQATDRAYRIGQKKDVYVYYPVITSKDFTTFDEKLDRLLEHKRSLAGDVLNGCPDVTIADFAINEVVPAEFAKDLDDKVNLDVALQMDWRLFEGLAAALWAKQGFTNVYCTPRSGDNGVDVVAIRNNEGALIQTKSSGIEGYKHGWDTVKEVIAGHAYYQRRHPDVEFKLIGLSNQYFNAHAHENAILNGVRLLGKHELDELLNTFPIKLSEVERFVYADEQIV